MKNKYVWTSHGQDPSSVNDNVKKFMLRAVLARWMFTPNKRVLDTARSMLHQSSIEVCPLSVHSPVHALIFLLVNDLQVPYKSSATLHIRRTDKRHEDPYYLQHASYRAIDEYAISLKNAIVHLSSSSKPSATLDMLAVLTDSSR